MAPVLELDRQTASFVRQLEEQRKLEKTLLLERVRGTKEGLESARLCVAYVGEFRQAPPAQFVNLLASPKQLRTHQDIASSAPSAALTMQVSASAGSGTTISVYESIQLVATTPNGHAYLDGIFSWEPLAVQMREG